MVNLTRKIGKKKITGQFLNYKSHDYNVQMESWNHNKPVILFKEETSTEQGLLN